LIVIPFYLRRYFFSVKTPKKIKYSVKLSAGERARNPPCKARQLYLILFFINLNKYFMKKIILSLIFVSVVLTGWSFSDKPGSNLPILNQAPAQSGNPISFFNAHRQGHAIGLMWRVSSSDDVISFQVQRSYDGEFFDPVANLASTANKRFTWQDENVFPGYIYYRVEATLMDGTTFYSEVEIVHIVQK
jgi:Phr family secreted Rap phosphatase inhibitor